MLRVLFNQLNMDSSFEDDPQALGGTKRFKEPSEDNENGSIDEGIFSDSFDDDQVDTEIKENRKNQGG